MTHDELLAKIVEKEPGTLTYSGGEIWHSTRKLVSWQLALLAVVELHKPTADGLGCSYEFIECHDHTGLGCDVPPTCNQYQSYPCPTIQAIEKELK